MVYALVHYPKIDTQQISLLRKKYDPQVDLIEPHITLMFPMPESIGEGNLVHHLQNALRNRQPFPIHLQGLQKSWDDYLFLMVQEGSGDIIDLHGRIYTGLLADYRKVDMPFVPHLTLGAFANNGDEYARALEEAKRFDLDYRCALDKLHLVKVNADRRRIVWSREFSLSE